MNSSIPFTDTPAPILGIDMSKATFNAHLILPDARPHSEAFSNDSTGFRALDAWLRQHQARSVRAGVEATGNYAIGLLMHLHAAAHRVSYLNPRRVKDFIKSLGRRAKTDALDAKDIALFVERLRPEAWTPPAAELSEMQALVRLRADIVGQLTATTNRSKTALVTLVKASLQRQIKAMKQEIARVDKQIDAHILAHPSLQKAVRLLRSIPGVGRIVSATILGEVPHLTSFARARDASAFAGVTPSIAESGTSVRRRGGMSKEGSSLLRKALYMAALNVIKRPNALQATYTQLVQRGKAKACSLGALMNKLMRVAFGVLKHQTPFTENFAKI